MNRMRIIVRCCGALAVIATLAYPASAVFAQGARPPRPVPRPAPLRPPGAERGPSTPPSKERIEKRLAQVKRRATARRAKREQRQRDRRKALRKRLRRMLGGRPFTDVERKELGTHARRIAQLRRIREIGAEKSDYELVIRVDKIIARENSRHDKWFRDLARSASAPKNAKGERWTRRSS